MTTVSHFSHQILLFRNGPTAVATTTCTLTSATPNTIKTASATATTATTQIAVLDTGKEDDKPEPKLKGRTNVSNVPLGAGKYAKNYPVEMLFQFIFSLCGHDECGGVKA